MIESYLGLHCQTQYGRSYNDSTRSFNDTLAKHNKVWVLSCDLIEVSIANHLVVTFLRA